MSGVPADPPPLRHFAHHGRAQHHGATIMCSRLSGGYCVAYATTPARIRRALASSRCATAVPVPPTSTLSGLRCVASAACAVGQKASPRLRRLHRNTNQGRFAPSVRTLVWGKSAAPIQHNAGLCKVRAVANKVGLVPAPLRPAAFAPFGFAQPTLCLAPQSSYRSVRFAHVAQQPDQRTRAHAPKRWFSQALRAKWCVVPPPAQRVAARGASAASRLALPVLALRFPSAPRGDPHEVCAHRYCCAKCC